VKKVVLLGEVHNNPKQHAMRVLPFENLLLEGKRPALLMEQSISKQKKYSMDIAK
jgi:uncharacterized iron-regulated protein